MRIAQIDTYCPTLPFRFAFAHGLASRSQSKNLIVRVTLANGQVGFGESVPRDYVTGETVEGAVRTIADVFLPRLSALDLSEKDKVVPRLHELFDDLGLAEKKLGAAFCALELALLDACGRLHKMNVCDFLGGAKRDLISYGAVVPFCKRRAYVVLLIFYKLYGFKTVKIKVGPDWPENIERLALARKILGAEITLRIDVNSVSNAEAVLKASKDLVALNVVSIEQPTAPDDFAGLAKISANTPLEVVVDESLCTIADAKELIARKACGGFNIRLSKVGGLLAARRIAALAREANITCHMGAQVGESGILSQAGRIFACVEEAMANYEGSDNAFLLSHDLTKENLTVGPGGKGKLLNGPGLGVAVVSHTLGKPESIKQLQTLVPHES